MKVSQTSTLAHDHENAFQSQSCALIILLYSPTRLLHAENNPHLRNTSALLSFIRLDLSASFVCLYLII